MYRTDSISWTLSLKGRSKRYDKNSLESNLPKVRLLVLYEDSAYTFGKVYMCCYRCQHVAIGTLMRCVVWPHIVLLGTRPYHSTLCHGMLGSDCKLDDIEGHLW